MKNALLGILAAGLIGASTLFSSVKASSFYDPNPYINQIYTISNHVNYDNWSQANPQYGQLESLCEQIKSEYPNLTQAASECISGAQLVVSGSMCSGNCHTDYNRKTYGPVVDKGLRTIDQASLVLSNYH